MQFEHAFGLAIHGELNGRHRAVGGVLQHQFVPVVEPKTVERSDELNAAVRAADPSDEFLQRFGIKYAVRSQAVAAAIRGQFAGDQVANRIQGRATGGLGECRESEVCV